jgi:hypothetical protein
MPIRSFKTNWISSFVAPLVFPGSSTMSSIYSVHVSHNNASSLSFSFPFFLVVYSRLFLLPVPSRNNDTDDSARLNDVVNLLDAFLGGGQDTVTALAIWSRICSVWGAALLITFRWWQKQNIQRGRTVWCDRVEKYKFIDGESAHLWDEQTLTTCEKSKFHGCIFGEEWTFVICLTQVVFYYCRGIFSLFQQKQRIYRSQSLKNRKGKLLERTRNLFICRMTWIPSSPDIKLVVSSAAIRATSSTLYLWYLIFGIFYLKIWI